MKPTIWPNLTVVLWLLAVLCLYLICAGCSPQPASKLPTPAQAGAMPNVQSRVVTAVAAGGPVIVPVQYPPDAANFSWSIYGGPTVSGPWTLLASNLVGKPQGTMAVPNFGASGFYKIVGDPLF